ncbi:MULTISPECIES: fluoride efflux transporter FluC [Halomonadaceae]|uniref:fluoride efflux transporter FluC n=1 Tax=Halomonadaceae TaxID=28256 RepID=UPI00136D01FA
MITEFVAVAAGSALGGLCRFHLTGWIDRRTHTPLSFGTLAVNTLGAFVLGLLVGTLGGATEEQPVTAALAMTGFCGSFTTVSSWSLQTITLARTHRAATAVFNLAATLVAGLGAVILGLAMTGGWQ